MSCTTAGRRWTCQANYYSRFWSNILLNTYHFAGIAITGLFFLAAHQLGYGGWHVLFKRVPLAMSRYLFVIFGLVVLITVGLLFDWHNLYGHWAHPHEKGVCGHWYGGSLTES